MALTRTKTKIQFAEDILSVFTSFSHSGRGYLEYIRRSKGGDEFDVRDLIVKPIFQKLGYEQNDFYNEVTISSGEVDLNIGPSKFQPVITVETKATNIQDLKPACLNQLFPYMKELHSPIGIVTNGVRFEVWEQKVAIGRIAVIDFARIVSDYLKRGVASVSDDDFSQILKLMYLKKEIRYIRDEDLYAIPEINIAEPTAFQSLLEDMAKVVEMAKIDVEEQFNIRMAEFQDYETKSKSLEGWQLQRLQKETKQARQMVRYLQRWAEINNIDLKKNGNATEKFITETMYILINRILLIRIAEDKGIIPRRISNGAIKDFKQFIKDVKINYNKLLYIAYDTMRGVYEHFFKHDIFDWYIPDSELLLRLLFVFNKYNFGNVNRDILGNLYQKYIDKEERKRLGQFYTPEEVVQYILDGVGYTSDAEIENKTLLDPACGSGGFLVPAANRLIARLKSKNFPAQTILEKVRDNIYGFDINPFAAHLTETNLLFQVVDLISEAKKLDPDFRMEQFNVFVTNSLRVSERDQEGKTMSLFEKELATSTATEDVGIVANIKMKRGRFKKGVDFVVSNPPYLRIQRLRPKELKEVYRKDYESAVGRFDLSVLFIERGITWLKPSGKLGFISSNKFMFSNYGKGIRKVILQNCSIEQLFDLTDAKLFEAATLPCIIILQKTPVVKKREKFPFVVLKEAKGGKKFKEVSDLFGFVRSHLNDEHLNLNIKLVEKGNHADRFNIRAYKSRFPESEEFWHFMPAREQELIEKIKSQSDCCLSDIAKIIVGIKTNADSIFTNPVTEQFIKNLFLETELIHPVLRGKNVRRWKISWTGKVPNRDTYIIYPHTKKDGKVLPVALSNYPNIASYLERNAEILRKRDYLLETGRKWYEIWVHQDPEDFMTKPKIVTPDFSPTNNFALDDYGFFCLGSCFVIIPKNRDEDFNKFILALLNSKLIEFFHKRSTSTFIYANRFRYWTSYMSQYPIVTYFKDAKSLSEIVDVAQNITKDGSVNSIDFQNRILSLNDGKYNFEDERKAKWIFRYIVAREIIQRVDELLCTINANAVEKRPISIIEREIDFYVYKLYGINQKEIEIIENFLSSFGAV